MSERFESTDVDPRLIIRVGGWLTATLLAVFLAIFILSLLFKGNARSITKPRVEVAAPRLQANPAHDLAELRAREEAALKTYRWLNRSDQTVSIPIERAIDLTLERGLPTRPTP